MKKIAILSDGWKRYVTYTWPYSIMCYAKEVGLDLCVYSYCSNGNLSHDTKANDGEYALFDFPDFEEYDGVVFDFTNTTDNEFLQRLIAKLKKYELPVVSISYYVDGFYYVGNDNKKLFRKLIDHLYFDHKVSDMVFAGGPIYNYENQQRFEAFKEACRDYGLNCNNDTVLFGDFDFGTGEKFIRDWLDSGKKLPQAFVCANDNIAAGICCEAEKRGLLVPRDFLVTGYDNLDKAAFYKPQITTVNHNRESIGVQALKILLNIWEKKEVSPFTYLDANLVCGESCGCKNNGLVDYRNYAKQQIENSVIRNTNEETILELEKRFAECNSVDGAIATFADYLLSLDCEDICIAIDKNLMSINHRHEFIPGNFNKQNLAIAYVTYKHKRVYSLNTIDEAIKGLNSKGSNDIVVSFPLHFRDSLIGIVTLVNPNFLYDNSIFYDVNTTFTSRLSDIYKQRQLEDALSNMRDLYNRDPMTKLYNRLAYSELIMPRFYAYQNDGISCAFIFFDVDNFKEINDSLGHSYGDKVLITIANAILKTKPKDGMAFRFGGDEFVVFFPYSAEEKNTRFINSLLRILDQHNISVSIGIIETDPSENKTLDEYLVAADKKMYEVKEKRHAAQKEVLLPSLTAFTDEADFYKGVDISSLPEKEETGVEFFDKNGKVVDALDLLEMNGVNSVRLRIWNNPQNVPESKGYCDLAHTLAMAKRIKAKNMHFVLDFHYSDYWADPGQQRKPKDWENLTFQELINKVYDYTFIVISSLAAVDAVPDMVQIGNEIRSGFLFPEGAVPNYEQMVALLNSGIKAVRDVSEDIKIMIHLDQGGRFYYLREWFDAAFAAGLDKIDAIGLSYYSFWHGTYMDLRDTMRQLIDQYDLPVYIMETAHPWRHCENDHVSYEMMKNSGLSAGIAEQKRAMELIFAIAKEASMEKETGVYYWEPLGITDKGFGSWDENMGFLDENAKPLPALEVFKNFNPYVPLEYDLDETIEDIYKNRKTQKINVNDYVYFDDFSKGYKDWWILKNPTAVRVDCAGEGVSFSSTSNFAFSIRRELFIDSPGDYDFVVEYKGTNTTGVHIEIILKTISFDGENEFKKEIFPNDFEFGTYVLDCHDLQASQIEIGIEIVAPPINGTIKSMGLIKR